MTPAELKSIRKALGITQQVMAERLGISRVHVAHMERGAKVITPRTVAQVEMLKRFPETESENPAQV